MNYIKNIIFCSGRDFNKLIPVVISSLNWHSSNSFNIFILHNDLIDSITKDRIYKVSERHHVFFIKVNTEQTLKSKLKGILPPSWLSGYETYTRLFSTYFIDNFCRQNHLDLIDSSLYLDLDLVIHRNLELINQWNNELLTNKFVIGGAIDTYNPEKNYINAGVILINHREIRDNNIEERFVEYIKKTLEEHTENEKLKFPDQDVINFALHKNELFIISSILQKQLHINKQITNEIILHFCGPEKPWKKEMRWRKHKIIWVKYKIISYFALKPTKFNKFLIWIIFNFLILIRPILNTLKINLI